MIVAALTFSGGAWALVGVVFAAFGGLLAYRGHRQRPAAPKLPLALRLIALALLALCLAEPSWTGEEAEPGANIIAVVADTSAGMTIQDTRSTSSRGEDLAALLSDGETEASWLGSISDTFSLRRFTADDRLRRTTDFNNLEFTGTASALGEAINSIQRRFAGRPVAGIVLLTDGNATDSLDDVDLESLPPIYPVVIGKGAPEHDLAITATAVSQSSFEDAPLTVRADLAVRGYSGKSITVSLINGNGETVASEQFTPTSSSDLRAVSFLHRPAASGVQFYRVEINSTNPEQDIREATTKNNARLIAVNRDRGPYRILYVCGRPNWEYKFLNRSLASDPELELAAIVRVARREPKFRWRGNGGTANPLFQGFDPGDDTAEFDKPVLIRLGIRSDEELAGGFPRQAEDLFGYHAIVIDDLERDFFTIDQLDLIDTFVARRGGSLLMLGGAESFQSGGYAKTAIAKMLPVHLGNETASPPTPGLQLDLTRDGWLSPWMRLRQTEADERQRLAGMAPFKSLNLAAGIKPGASILATATDAKNGSRHPALVAQRFGKGRSAALLIADFWRWGFSVPENSADMEKAWRQLARWLVADVPEQVSVKLEAASNGAVKAVIKTYDDTYTPLADARVTLTLEAGDAAPVELNARPSDTEAGVFEATFLPGPTGTTLVRASVTTPSGETVGEATDGWAENAAADEFKRLEPNRALLESLASATGGEVLAPGDLKKFAQRLPTLDVPETRTRTRALWHTPFLFLLVLGCFAAEWILRRRAGMA